MNDNVFIWITGYPGVGKTTLATAYSQYLKLLGRKVVHLDGDQVRKMFPGLGYSDFDRLQNAIRISVLAQDVFQRGYDVICSTVSLIHDIQDFNRAAIPRYYEFLLDESLEILAKRKPDVYEQLRCDDFQLPRSPDLVIKGSPAEVLEEVVAYVGL